MDFGPKPEVWCIAGYEYAGGCRVASCRLTLEDAAALAALGWTVMCDPLAMEALTRWEQLQRSVQLPRITW